MFQRKPAAEGIDCNSAFRALFEGAISRKHRGGRPNRGWDEIPCNTAPPKCNPPLPRVQTKACGFMRMTPAEMLRVSLAVASTLAGSAVFNAVAAEVAACSLSQPGYTRPVTSFFQGVQERQQAPELPGAEGLLVAEREHIEAHIALAKKLNHPLARLVVEAQPDLVQAVQWLYGIAHDSGAIKAARDAMTARVMDWKRRLKGVDAQLSAIQTPQAAAVQQDGCSMATFAAIIKGCGLPDTEFTAHQCSGFPCVGDYPDSGLFRECERPATKDFGSMHHRLHRESVQRTLERQALDPAQRHVLERVTAKKYGEVIKGVAKGPLASPEEVNTHLKEGTWRPLHCFGVVQGEEEDGTPKVRPCDNAGKSAGTNECLSTHETIACEQPSFPVLVAALFEACGGAVPLHHSTDDVELAYRRMAAAQPEATVVMIWDTNREAVSYFLMDGHNFGLAAAVLSFNRHSQLVACMARRLYGVPCAAYFDDFDTTDPVGAGKSGKEALHTLCRLMGVPLSRGTKDVDPAASNPFLGVVADLSRVVDGVAVLKSKVTRVARMIVDMQDILGAGVASKATMEQIVGKLEYTSTSGAAGRFGRAASECAQVVGTAWLSWCPFPRGGRTRAAVLHIGAAPHPAARVQATEGLAETYPRVHRRSVLPQ